MTGVEALWNDRITEAGGQLSPAQPPAAAPRS